MTGKRILFVDDDRNVLSAYYRLLHKRYSISMALNGDEGLATLQNDGPFAVIVADMQMPGMDGVQFLRTAREKAPDTVRLMLTGNADQKTAVDAVNQGHVFSFLTKPCAPEVLGTALDNAVRQYQVVLAEKALLEQTLNGAVKLLTEVLAVMDPQAFGRGEKLCEEVRVVSTAFPTSRSWELELAAMLAEIGYVTIPPTVLTKVRSGLSLSGPEKDILVRVPQTGADLISHIPRLHPVAEIVRYQHKNFDGSGFPSDNVAGEEIPIGARIIRILADLLQLEKERKSRPEAFQELHKIKGRYDSKVLEAVAACFDIYINTSKDDDGSTQQIGFKDLTLGHVLASDVTTIEGTLLVTRNAKVSPLLLERLRNFHQLSGIREPILVR